MLAARVLVLCALGCGRIGFDAQPQPGDGDAQRDGSSSSGSDAFASGPFGPAMPIAGLSDMTTEDDDPSLTDDMLEIYFNSDRTGNLEIWMSKRTTVTDPWPAPSLVTELNSTNDESTPEVSGDGLTIFLSSRRPGGAGDYDVYVSARATRTAAWSAPVRVPELCTTAQDGAPRVADAGRYAIFPSLRTGGEYELWSATRVQPSDAWSTPQLVSELSTVAYDGDAWVDASATMMYFSSGRPGSLDVQDIWYATRASVGDPWGTPTRVAELASTARDGDPWLSPDGHTMVFASQRAAGNYDIYVATR